MPAAALVITWSSNRLQLRDYQAQLAHQVRHDTLTEIANRANFEEQVTGRLTDGDHEEVPIERVSCGQLRERDVAPVLAQVRTDAEELRAALLG